ncbi:MAG: glycoside hydrolase family 2 TIM barrel-domain containing protein [Candidatus Spyradenecus sp.]
MKSLYLVTGLCSAMWIAPLAVATEKAAAYGPEVYAELPAWENPYVTEENRLPSRTVLTPFATAEEALANAALTLPREASPYILSLNGAWRFAWAKQPSERVQDFWQPAFDVSDWGYVTVPGCWQLQGAWDPPIYTNSPYPHAATPPRIMVPQPEGFTSATFPNPVGSYRRTFRVPEAWHGRRTVIHFDGVASAMKVWVNGTYVGYSEDSRLPAEFDLTALLRPGEENILAVEVYRWCDGSYLEDQDFWRLSGIFRDVWLVSEQSTGLRDYVATTTLDGIAGELTVQAELAGEAELTMSLYDGTRKVGDLQSGRLRVESVEPWSAEVPKLYYLLFTVKAQGQTDYLAKAVGFREITLDAAQVKINGRRVLFKGVNRHEMRPERGYTLTREEMLEDIRQMQAMNINAVRTCHYPNASDWYDLCDKYGLYLVDEANVEAHGMGYDEASLAHRPDYLAQHLERNRRMILRDRNHPSVIFWSMGNESGYGENFRATYRQNKALDPTRPTQYERADTDPKGTDIYCPMYAWPDHQAWYAGSNPKMPYILTEYAHAMGNSQGSFRAYWENVRRFPSAQGGFIWDWRDQALWKPQSGIPGGRFLAYGGDFGDKPNDGNFNCNGLLAADGQWHPSAYEVRTVQQNVSWGEADFAAGQVTLTNDFIFRTLAGFSGTWELIDERGSLASGSLDCTPLQQLAPGKSATLALTGWPTLPASDVPRYLTLRLFDTPSAYHVPVQVADAQFTCPASRSAAPAASEESSASAWRLETSDAAISYTCPNASARFDRRTGYLAAYRVAGRDLLLAPLTPNLWRALTDNDRGQGMDWNANFWRTAIEKAHLLALEPGDKALEARYTLPEARNESGEETTLTLRYTFGSAGAITVDFTLAVPQGLPDLLRVGLTTRLPQALNEVEWFGRGPHEAMPDRTQSAYFGHYSACVRLPAERSRELNASGYVRNGEHGYRMDLRQLVIREPATAAGLRVTGERFHFNLWPFTQEALADQRTPHPHELPYAPENTLNLDATQYGAAGVNSWGARPFDGFRPTAGKPYRLTFTFRAL